MIARIFFPRLDNIIKYFNKRFVMNKSEKKMLINAENSKTTKYGFCTFLILCVSYMFGKCNYEP